MQRARHADGQAVFCDGHGCRAVSFAALVTVCRTPRALTRPRALRIEARVA